MHVLCGLGSLIDKPMFMDRLTTSQFRVAFVRICVELKGGELPPKTTSLMSMVMSALRKSSMNGFLFNV